MAQSPANAIPDDFVDRAGLKVAPQLAAFLEDRALPDSGVTPQTFWEGFADLIATFDPQVRDALAKRDTIQAQIDDWHRDHRGQAFDADGYRAFLTEIGYIEPEGDDFQITTEGLDPEISHVPGPQLVVPITNARYVLNAANARWGSLYDAIYGTDVLGDLPPAGGLDPDRGRKVIAWAKGFLDEVCPLRGGSHTEVTEYRVENGSLRPALKDPGQFVGYEGDTQAPSKILLKNNGLHIVIHVDASHPVAELDDGDIADIQVESAMSAIIDCEDSVACVDADDKVLAYSNWLGLMRGDLTAELDKGGKTVTRKLSGDPAFTASDGGQISLKGRALMLIRNVGHLMTTPAIRDGQGREIGEGLMDAMVTTLIAKHDLARDSGNSVAGSVYIVKPKMHGSAEVALSDAIFSRVEEALGLPQNTVKLGIMDEERRTSVNLKECIRAAKNRVAFINTGFLDRTGDEIHTSMEAGAMLRKGEMKGTDWLAAYEARNVEIGLACGLKGRAQIGKGMWPMPDKMADMLDAKIGHPNAGANTAWVPSPTAATLHATHYHKVDVFAVQDKIAATASDGRLDALLTIPIAQGRNWSPDEITAELENNCQGILGYVVRWIDHGVGCSKVPDINDVGLMEDRATCRISSQTLANWLHQGVVDNDQIMAAMQKMAEVVDRQNADDAAYTPMAPKFDGHAFRAACDLVFKGTDQPSGYTEPLLHAHRLAYKAETA